LGSTSRQIQHVADTLSENAKQSFDASAQLSSSMDAIAKTTENQLTIIEDNRTVVSGINENIQTINRTSQTASRQSTMSAEEAQKGSQLTETLLNQMKTLHKDVDESFTTIQELNQRSQDIESIIEV